MQAVEKIAICICTRNRPQLLKECLNSLNDQIIPEGTSIEIIVIDNGDEDDLRSSDVVHNFASTSNFKIWRSPESRVGIPFARNSALLFASSLGIKWIAFIDDDGVADKNWISTLYRCAKNHDAEGVTGPQHKRYPEGTPEYKKGAGWGTAKHPTGTVVDMAATSNFMFNLDFALKNSLCFCDSLGNSGGEDTQFSWEFTKKGGKIVWCDEAVVTETVTKERTELRHHWRFGVHAGMNFVFLQKLKGEYARTHILSGIRKMIVGFSSILGSFISLDPQRKVEKLFKGVSDAGNGVGLIMGEIGVRSTFYDGRKR